MTKENRLENARLEKAKGDSSWEEATILFEKAKYDGAVSRGYYAAFHYACSLLLTKGLEGRSHRGTQRLFHPHFIRTGIFPNRIGVLLSHSQKAREEADYFPEITFTRETAEAQLNEIEQFLQAARAHLAKSGL